MTTKIIMRRGQYGLLPADTAQQEAFDDLPWHVDLAVEVKRPRHPQHHRLFFSLLNLTVHNTDDFPTVDLLLTWLKIKLGHVETIIWESGKTYYVPKSINFASMDQESFRKFFDRALDAIVQKYGWDRPGLLDEIENATGIHWREAA